ncbi:MAG: sulfotransferase family 2 domain-containing protein [Ardenticatenaceae bacterium]|nr:sulfotransferase family 2 domain-containing protein [Ardenticatenaceae bacterium]
MKKSAAEGEKGSSKTVIFLHIPKTAGVTIRHLIRKQYRASEMYHHNLLLPKEMDEALGNLSSEQKSQIRILWGHLIFGVHTYLPEPTTYFTFLRNPIERTISHYYYVLSRPQEFEIATYIMENQIGFHEALERELIRDIQNVQTRMIAGLPYDYPPNTYTEAHLETAKQNLAEHFAVVGLVERFDESLLLLKKAFGWGNVS